jgi:tetratricopeptide (TPR) repeat protein
LLAVLTSEPWLTRGRNWIFAGVCDVIRRNFPATFDSNVMQDNSEKYSSLDFHLSATMHMSKRDPMTALAVCIEGLEHYPEDAKLLCMAARCCVAQRYLDEARLYINKARSLHLADATVHESHADLLMLEGMPGEAVKFYRQAQSLQADNDGIQKKIDHARVTMNRMRPVEGERGVKVVFPEEMARAGRLERDDEGAQAETIYRNILRRYPEHVEAMRRLAAIATKHRKYKDAEVLLQQAVKVAPDYARARLDLSVAQLDQNKLEEAIATAQQLVELAPGAVENYLALGNALARADRAAEAAETYQKALDISPQNPGAFSGLGQQLKTVGRQADAIDIYRRSIESNPRNAESYWSLGNMRAYRFTDDDIEAMESLLQAEDLDDLASAQVCNALGFAFEGRKNFDQAFSYFQQGNEKHRASETYDPVETEVATDRQIKVFTEDFVQNSEGNGASDASPIFIVGLPRSGSTLIEQILASHSQVEGTHELSDLGMAVRGLPRQGKGQRFPENLPGLKPHLWSSLGEGYVQRTQQYREGAPRFIDKNPNNFNYIGLIHLILPNARIINARRHPMDSCLGSYKQLFAQGQPFTYDLTEIGEYYLQYQRLMDHWHDLMPGVVLDVQYEDVVGDLEGQVRRILDYCDLPFEQACLDFHQTERAVKTASSEQVRQPIYSSSLNLWENYRPHLSELIEVLEPLLAAQAPGKDEIPAL